LQVHSEGVGQSRCNDLHARCVSCVGGSVARWEGRDPKGKERRVSAAMLDGTGGRRGGGRVGICRRWQIVAVVRACFGGTKMSARTLVDTEARPSQSLQSLDLFFFLELQERCCPSLLRNSKPETCGGGEGVGKPWEKWWQKTVASRCAEQKITLWNASRARGRVFAMGCGCDRGNFLWRRFPRWESMPTSRGLAIFDARSPDDDGK
jgi:hypothetical protein